MSSYQQEYNNLKKYNWEQINKDVKNISKFLGVFSTYQELQNLILGIGWFGIVASGSEQGIYIKSNVGWLPITTSNTEDELLKLLLDISILFDVLINKYYDSNNGYLEVIQNGLFHIVGLEQNNELTLNPLVRPIIYNSNSEVLLNTNIFFNLNNLQINNTNFNGEIKVVYLINNEYYNSLINLTNYRFLKDRILVIYENIDDSHYYIMAYQKYNGSTFEDCLEFVLLPKGIFSFEDGWNIKTTSSTFNQTFVSLFNLTYDSFENKFKPVYEFNSEVSYIRFLLSNLKYSYSKIYSQFTQLKNQINVTDEKIQLVSQQDINHVFDNKVLLIGNVIYFTDLYNYKRIGITNSKDPEHNLIIVLNNTDYLNMYDPSYRLDVSDEKFYVCVLNGYIDRLFSFADTLTFPPNIFDPGSYGGNLSQGVIYLTKEQNDMWYYFNPQTQQFEVMPLYEDIINNVNYNEGEYDNRLYKILFVEIKDFLLANIYKHLDFFIDKPYSNTLAIEIIDGNYIELRTSYIPPNLPNRLVKTLIKIGGADPLNNGVGKIILDGNVEINGNVIQQGTVSFTSFNNSIKNTFYKLVFNPIELKTLKKNLMIQEPIKSFQVNVLKNTDKTEIQTLDNIKIYVDNIEKYPGDELTNGVVLKNINLLTNTIEIDCTNQTQTLWFDVLVTFTDIEPYTLKESFKVDFEEQETLFYVKILSDKGNIFNLEINDIILELKVFIGETELTDLSQLTFNWYVLDKDGNEIQNALLNTDYNGNLFPEENFKRLNKNSINRIATIFCEVN